MPPPQEAEIRDRLAQRLELLEPELQLVETEYHLPNQVGGKGFVDVLARDRFGLLVVIELKRSDTTARQAIHEIHKYTALLRTGHGIAADGVRCMVVSTTWHELLVPFSEFEANVPYRVDGYRLSVDEEGNPLSAEVVEPLDLTEGLELCPTGFVFLYGSSDARAAQRAMIEEAARSAGIEDYLLVEQDHEGESPRVVYPFSDSLLIAATGMGRREELVERFELDPEEVDPDESPWYLDELLLGDLNERMDRAGSMDVESFFPDKFRTHEDAWPVRCIRRFGPRLSSELRTDEQLLEMIRGDLDGHSSALRRIVSPGTGAAWSRFRVALDRCLTGNESWHAIAGAYLDELEARDVPAVAVSAFNPADLTMGLYKLVESRSMRYLPALQIVPEPDADVLTALLGDIAWDGQTVHHDPQELLDAFFHGDVMDYFIARTAGGLWEEEDDLLRWHGLSCVAFEVTIEEGADSWSRVERDGEGGLRRIAFDRKGSGMHSMVDFANAHREYLGRLALLIQAHSVGL